MCNHYTKFDPEAKGQKEIERKTFLYRQDRPKLKDKTTYAKQFTPWLLFQKGPWK